MANGFTSGDGDTTTSATDTETGGEETTTTDAADQLRDRDPGSGSDTDGTNARDRDTGITSGSGDVATGSDEPSPIDTGDTDGDTDGDTGGGGGSFSDDPTENVGRPPDDQGQDPEPSEPTFDTPDDDRTLSGNRGQRAEEVAEEYVAQNEFVDDPNMVTVDFQEGGGTGDEYVVRLRPEARDTVARRRAAAQFDGYRPLHFRVENDMVVLRDSALRSEIAEQEGVDETDIQSIDRTDDGVAYELTPRAQIARQTGLDERDIERVERTEDGYRPVLTEDARQERVRDQVLETLRTDQRPVGTGLTPGSATPVAASVVEEDDIVFDDSGQPQYTEETQREIAGARSETFSAEDFVVTETEAGETIARPRQDAVREAVAEQQGVDPDRVAINQRGDEYFAAIRPDEQKQGPRQERDAEQDGIVDVGVETNFEQFYQLGGGDEPVVDLDVETRRPGAVDDVAAGVRNVEARDFVPAEIQGAAALAGFLAENPGTARAAGSAAVDSARDVDVSSALSTDAEFDTNVQYVSPDAVAGLERGVETVTEEVTSGDYFDAGAVAGSPESGGEATGRAAQQTQESVEDAEIDPEARDFVPQEVQAAAAVAGFLAENPDAARFTATTGAEQARDTAGGTRETGAGVFGAARDIASQEYFAAGALSPSGAGGEATGRAARETRADAPGYFEQLRAGFGGVERETAEVEAELASGFPQGVEAGGGPGIETAGVAAAAGTRRGGASYVGALVRRSPVGAPGRIGARGVAKGLAATGLLAGGAVAIEEVRDRRRREEPTATATEVGVGTGIVESELEVGEQVAGGELEVTGDRRDIAELEPGSAGVTATEVGAGEGVVETEVEIPGDGDGGGTGDGRGQVTRDGSVVPGNYPLPGRDIPRNQRLDRPQQVDPTDLIDTGLGTAQMLEQRQRQRQERDDERTAVDEQLRRRRRAERRELEEILRGPPGEVTIGRRRGFLQERGFFTGASAVIGRGVERTEEAQRSDLAEESVLDVAQGEAQRPLQEPVIAPFEGADTAVRPVTTSLQETAQATALDTQLEQEAVTETGEETVPETIYEQEYGYQNETVEDVLYGEGLATPTANRTPFLTEVDRGPADGRRRGREDAVIEELTDFRNPLSGGVLETESGRGGLI